MAPYFAQYRVLDAAGRLLEHRLLVCRRTRMAEKRSRGESFRVHTRLLAPAHVQRCNSITQEGMTAQAFWQLLYEYNADLVLNGHDHLYARYRPLDPYGNSDPREGHTGIHRGHRRRDTRSDRHNHRTRHSRNKLEILAATRISTQQNLEA